MIDASDENSIRRMESIVELLIEKGLITREELESKTAEFEEYDEGGDEEEI